MLNYRDAPPGEATPEEIAKWDQSPAKVQQRLNEAAGSPLLRRLITAHVLATETQVEMWSYGADEASEAPGPRERCLRWLATLEKAGLRQVDDADHLGWVAYAAGRYEEAGRWLTMAPADSATTLWLKAKLLRREGKLSEAVELMAKAFKLVRASDLSFGDTEYSFGARIYTPDQSAAGDLAGLHLTRGEFVSTMDAFLQGNLWDDAAFIGDRVLTVDELKHYVDEHLPESEEKPEADNTRVRWLLARRLVRVDRYAEARPYFPKKQRPVLDDYTTALNDGENSKLSRTQRARAIFTAAWIARYDGMELMGTEEEPDGFVNGGRFPAGDLDLERGEGVQLVAEFDEAKKVEVMKRKPVKLLIPATAAEKQRLAQTRPQPSKRFHYRYVAAGLAWKAAGLLPDGVEELADVLNTGGSWIKDRDEKLADKYFQALEHRCAGTKIRKATAAKHWFVDDMPGPWSGPLSSARDTAAGGK
jgi:tetratricopeptide (TPR) repeat protein